MTFWPKMSKFWHLGSDLSKINVKFELSTFEIEYVRNFVKIRQSILFGLKCANLGNWVRNLNNES